MRVRRAIGSFLLLSGVLALLFAAYYVFDFVREDRALALWLDQRTASLPQDDDRAVVDDLVGYLSGLPTSETTGRMGYWNPLYGVLKARPIDVLQNGGFCGNRARLLVTLFHMRGIPSRVTYVYNTDGWSRPELGQPYITAFVEVRLDDRWAAVEPYLAVLFLRADGSPATAADLAADPTLISARAPTWYKTDLYNYREIRGIRWGKFPGGEKIRSGLASVTSPSWVNDLHYPFWVHRPNLLIALASGAAGTAALLLGRRLFAVPVAPATARAPAVG